jgi:hypothetical protein
MSFGELEFQRQRSIYNGVGCGSITSPKKNQGKNLPARIPRQFGVTNNLNGRVSAMRGQKQNGESSDVIPFVQANGEAERNSTQLDQAGQAILQLVGRAAEVAEGNSRQAMDRAQRLSHQLHAAEDRIKQLEAEVASQQEKADHAERWLHRIYTEIESRFLSQETHRAVRH